jgi:hypothetical protein
MIYRSFKLYKKQRRKNQIRLAISLSRRSRSNKLKSRNVSSKSQNIYIPVKIETKILASIKVEEEKLEDVEENVEEGKEEKHEDIVEENVEEGKEEKHEDVVEENVEEGKEEKHEDVVEEITIIADISYNQFIVQILKPLFKGKSFKTMEEMTKNLLKFLIKDSLDIKIDNIVISPGVNDMMKTFVKAYNRDYAKFNGNIDYVSVKDMNLIMNNSKFFNSIKSSFGKVRQEMFNQITTPNSSFFDMYSKYGKQQANVLTIFYLLYLKNIKNRSFDSTIKINNNSMLLKQFLKQKSAQKYYTKKLNEYRFSKSKNNFSKWYFYWSLDNLDDIDFSDDNELLKYHNFDKVSTQLNDHYFSFSLINAILNITQTSQELDNIMLNSTNLMEILESALTVFNISNDISNLCKLLCLPLLQNMDNSGTATEKLNSYVSQVFNSSKQELYKNNFFHKLKLYKSKLTHEYTNHMNNDNIIAKNFHTALLSVCAKNMFLQMTTNSNMGAITILPLIEMVK